MVKIAIIIYISKLFNIPSLTKKVQEKFKKINYPYKIFLIQEDYSIGNIKELIRQYNPHLIVKLDNLILVEPLLINKMIESFLKNNNDCLYLIIKVLGKILITKSNLINNFKNLNLFRILNKKDIKISSFHYDDFDFFSVFRNLDYFYRSPRLIYINITNDCTAECIMCPGRKYFKKNVDKIGYMKFDLFKKIIEEASKLKPKPTIILQSYGEPLIHPQFLKMLKFLKEKEMFLSFNTNGLFLTKEIANELINFKNCKISVSLDAYTRKTYNKIRKKSNFKIVIRNLKYLLKIKGKKHNPNIFVSLVEMNQNKEEINKFVRYWIKKVNAIYVSSLEYEDLSINKDFKNLKKYFICLFPWTNLAVWWDGKINCCLEDCKQTTNFGDINKETIKEIWNSKGLKDFRKKHFKLNFKGSICQKCDFWRSYIMEYEIKKNMLITKSEKDRLIENINKRQISNILRIDLLKKIRRMSSTFEKAIANRDFTK